MYVDGTMDLFAHQTNVDLQNHCICFNTVKLGKSMQSIGMMTVLDQIWNRHHPKPCAGTPHLDFHR